MDKEKVKSLKMRAAPKVYNLLNIFANSLIFGLRVLLEENTRKKSLMRTYVQQRSTGGSKESQSEK